MCVVYGTSHNEAMQNDMLSSYLLTEKVNLKQKVPQLLPLQLAKNSPYFYG